MLTFAELQELVQKSGLGYTLLVVVIFIGGSVATAYGKTLVRRGWSEHHLVRYRLRRAHKTLVTVLSDLTKHTFFSAHLNVLHITIPHIYIVDPMRRAMFKDLLSMYTQTFYNNVSRYVSDVKVDEMDQQDFQKSVYELYTRSMSDFELQCTVNGIPAVVMYKFSEWHASTRESTMNFITQATSSNFYTSNRVRMCAILDWFTASLQVTMLSAERTLGELNGDLDGTVYKGLVAVHQEN